MPEGETIEGPESEADLVFAGFCAFLDPAKPSAAEAIVRLRALGVRVKIVSGDAAPVLLHVVTSLGLPCKGLLTGEEIEVLDHPGLVARVEEVDLYARVSPDQKRRVILALKAHGHTVGFIGDGINDAPRHPRRRCRAVRGRRDRGRARRRRPDPAGT